MAPPLLLTLGPQLAIGHPLVAGDVTLLALAALPLSVGLAIARVTLFDIALRRRTRWVLRRAAVPAGAAALAGLGMLAGQEPWRLLLPFGEAGVIGAVALVYYARRPGRPGPRGQTVPVPDDGGRDPCMHSVQPPAAGADRPQPRAKKLSPREIDILTCAAQGLRTREIAAHLHMGERTVGTHLTRIYEKLDVHTRTEAVMVALEQRLLPRRERDGPRDGAARPTA